MNLMLLAAGEGTRLRPHTLLLPKPAIPFLNVPLAAWSFAFLGTTKINRMCANTFHLPQKISQLFTQLPLPTSDFHLSHETDKILGSGGGLGRARKHFQGQGPLILMNSDEVILPEQSDIVEKAMTFHQNSKAISTLLVIEHPEVGHKFGGVWVDSQNRVIGFGKERPAEAVKGWHFVGVQILSDSIFEFIPDNEESNILYDGLMTAMKAGHQVQVFPFNCLWFETGNPTDFLAATENCLKILHENPHSAEGRYIQSVLNRFCGLQWRLESGHDYLCLVSSSAKVSLNARLEGFSVIGSNSEIASDAVVKNSVIGSDLQISSSEKITQQIKLG